MPCFVIIPLMHVTRPVRARFGAQHLDHLRQCLQVVVVERAAGERHAAGDGELAISPDPELVRLHLHRGGEAAVQVEVIGVARIEPGQLGELLGRRR